MPWKRRKECKEGRVPRPEKEGDRKMFGESLWKLKMRSHKIQSIQDKRKHMQKENAAAEEEVRKLRDEVKQKEERILFSVG